VNIEAGGPWESIDPPLCLREIRYAARVSDEIGIEWKCHSAGACSGLDKKKQQTLTVMDLRCEKKMEMLRLSGID
jgi:hypothetical protein